MILCCGEALIDMIPEATESGAIGYVPHCGGAVFNTAIALGRLGASAALFTGLSRDGFGQQLQAALQDSQVDTSYLVHSDQLTTLAMVQLSHGQARYSFYDENSAGQALRPGDLPELEEATAALYFGGISLVNGPAAEVYAQFAESQKDRRLIMLDPNIRPGLAEDEPRYRARLARMIACADIVKLSDEDLDWLQPGAASQDDKIAALLAQGPQLALLTRGSDGAEAYHRNGTRVRVAATPVTVADTVGAGDTFNAGALARMQETGLLDRAALQQADAAALEQVLAFAARVAAVTVSRAGANPPWREEL